MALGLLGAGMTAGATLAALWLLAGGSLLAAIAIYGLVGAAFVLGTALLNFWLSERKERAAPDALHPAE